MSAQEVPGAVVVRAALLAGFKPDERLTVSEWADRHRVLDSRSSAEPGQWRTSRTPYLREIMDSMSSLDPTEIVVVMKGAQIGATECGNNWIGYVIHHAPGPALFVQPTVEMAKRTSKQRIASMIERCPDLRERVMPARSRDSGNTLLTKEFPGGLLVITGANSAVGLRSMPTRYLFLDEVDGYEADVDGEGDPVALAMKRTATYARNRKVLAVSTPTVKGISRIEAMFNRSDQRYFEVPCPHCGHYDAIWWRNIRWPEGDPSNPVLVCEACEKEIEEYRKDEMLSNGRWVPTSEGSEIRGYHLSALYSPLGWYSWREAVSDFLAAKAAGPELMKTWVNTVLGETWEERGDTVHDSQLFARREQYPAEVPAGALVLTAGVDLQDDRIELEVVGWGRGEECWAIDYRVVWGDPGQELVWRRLDEALQASYQHENGAVLRIPAVCLDTGGHHTQQAYEFIRRRGAGRVFAIVGRAGFGRPIVKAPTKQKTGRQRIPVNLFTVGVDEVKGMLYSRLRLLEPGPGYCHFPISEAFGAEYFAQLAAEKLITRYVKGIRKREWVNVRPGRRNEALDCRVYATAALYILNPVWDALEAQLAKKKDERTAVQREAAARQRRHRRGGWMSGLQD